MSEAVKIQDPIETLDYPFDWTTWLAAGDTIATASWAITPAGPVLSGSDTPAGNVTTKRVAGVTLGATYRLINTVITTAGRTMGRSYTIRGFSE